MHVTVHDQVLPSSFYFHGYKRARGGGEPGDEASLYPCAIFNVFTVFTMATKVILCLRSLQSYYGLHLYKIQIGYLQNVCRDIHFIAMYVK